MDLTTNRRDDPQVIDVAEPMGPADTIEEAIIEEAIIEEALRARLAARFAAIEVANTAAIVASSISLAVGVGIGMAIATARSRRG